MSPRIPLYSVACAAHAFMEVRRFCAPNCLQPATEDQTVSSWKKQPANVLAMYVQGISPKEAELSNTPPAAEPDKRIWALSRSSPFPLAGCPCPMCQAPGCMMPALMSPTGQTSIPARQNCGTAAALPPPASPGSCYSEVRPSRTCWPSSTTSEFSHTV